MSYVITLDGNIGAGKTTVLELLAAEKEKEKGFKVDLEPVESWQPWLNRMYQTGNGVFEFQLRVWLDRCWPKAHLDDTYYIMERSPMFQEGVFIPANVSNNRLTGDQVTLLKDMYAKVNELWEPNMYIYLRSDPAKCAERIIRRARKSEDAIPMHYLQELHDLHEKTLIAAQQLGKKIVVVDMEGKTPTQIAAEILSHLSP
jgi:deoxyadenosine/deoxycytidine kinase